MEMLEKSGLGFSTSRAEVVESAFQSQGFGGKFSPVVERTEVVLTIV